MKRTILLTLVLLFLFAAEILRVYFIMPFPGSQRSNAITVAYFLNNYIWWFRIAGFVLLVPLLLHVYRKAKWWKKIFVSVFVILYAVVFYFVNFKFLAEKMFYQPKNKILVNVADNKVDSTKLVIGISMNGEAKAYPIEIIGYHHQVQDTLGGEPVMVTYCTVCRTGRVFSPIVNGKLQQFRLVGMDLFNAMFEDADTKSWWRQATGIAVSGPMKGTVLKEIASQQMRLGAWVRRYPNTLIMQPDINFEKQYKGLQGFDAGTIESSLEKRDSASWKFKSWVVGVLYGGHAKAYDWNELVKQKIINDTIQSEPIILVLEKDGTSFHAWNCRVNGQALKFSIDEAAQTLKDNATNSIWNMDGICTEGQLKGTRLSAVPAYQEFWHSWQSFHPSTTVWR